MAKWRTEKRLYEVHEIGRGINEVYTLYCTGNEISQWCRTKNEMNGYVEGLGGDRSYGCWAVQMAC